VRLPRMGRPSPALVLACVALFVALGGTGYAALQLPANSVGSKQIRNGAVKNSEIANNAVTGRKVRRRSLTASDFRASSLPRGPRGFPGPAGPAGPTGPAGSARAYGYVNGDGTLDPASSKGNPTVSHVATSGVYCIAIPRISSATSVMSVNLDFAGSATTSPPADPSDDQGIVEVDYSTPTCAAGQFEVNTLAQTFTTGALVGNTFDDQPFVFIVP
jgi:hypothetical protein